MQDFRNKYKQQVTVMDRTGIVNLVKREGRKVEFVKEEPTSKPVPSKRDERNVIRLSAQISLNQKLDQMVGADYGRLVNRSETPIDEEGLTKSWIMESHSYPLSSAKVLVTSPYIQETRPEDTYICTGRANYCYGFDRPLPLHSGSKLGESYFSSNTEYLTNSQYIYPLRGVDEWKTKESMSSLWNRQDEMINKRKLFYNYDH